MITFQSYALDFKRTFYEGQLYSNDDLSVENNNSISSFINNYGFRQIEIKNYKKWYLIDGNIDYALMSFSIFDNILSETLCQ